MDAIFSLSKKLNRKPTAKEIQEAIFDKMPAEKKLKLVGQWSKLSLKLSQLDDGNYRSNTTAHKNSSHSGRS